MNLLKQTKQLCDIYNIKPARSKGQNFLIKEDIYNKIIESADLKKEDIVLEVGPGLGFLTAKLAEKVKKVMAVELDDKLAEVLKAELISQGVKNVEVVNENILDLPPPLLGKEGSYKIVANLPYNITSVFLRKFLSREHKPSLMVLMLQKEVAQRITAKPGKMSILAVSVQFYAKPEIVEYVPRNNFWPEPKVDSAVIKLEVRSPAYAKASADKQKFKVDENDFFRLVKIGFSAKRKMLKNNLSNGYHISHDEAAKRLKRAGFSQNIRAQELSVADWIKLLGEF